MKRVKYNRLYDLVIISAFFASGALLSCSTTKKVVATDRITGNIEVQTAEYRRDTVVRVNRDTVYSYLRGDTVVNIFNSTHYSTSSERNDAALSRSDTVYIHKTEQVREREPINSQLLIYLIVFPTVLLVIGLFLMRWITRR